MANLLWGKVYLKGVYTGLLKEEPGGAVSFQYDASYIDEGGVAVSHSLPVREELYICHGGLHPYFDNLVSEGWLEKIQTRLLGKRNVSRFEILLAFGYDCAGCLSVVDADPAKITDKLIDIANPVEISAINIRASLSGVQPKLPLSEKEGVLLPAAEGELSTHIAKLFSPGHEELLENEYLTTQAFGKLLPDDSVVNVSIAAIKDITDKALLVKRFDREAGRCIHFEEFNQLLNRPSKAKYDGDYDEMANFIRKTPQCIPAESYKLFCRVFVGLLLGNTDMHFKNFSMVYTPSGLRLSPSYDQVCASLYGYNVVALAVAGESDIPLKSLRAKHVLLLGQTFNLSITAISLAVQSIEKNLSKAKQVIEQSNVGSSRLRESLVSNMEKRWNSMCGSIGKLLSAKQKDVEKS